jgi:predicted nucleic acid-binding Zn ribbon protein
MDKIETCKKCSNQKFDRNQGIVCGLTGNKPTFEETCPDYKPTQTAIFNETNREPIRPNQQRAKNAVILIWCIMILDVVCIISSYLQYDLLNTVNEGGFISDGTAELNDNRELIIGILYFIVSLVSIVTFIQWFRRAYYNLNIRKRNCSYSEGWAAGCWFVPIIALFRPYQIMKEMWVETSKLINNTSTAIIKNDSTAIIGVWWALWIVTNYVANYALKTTVKGDSLADYMNATMGDIVTSVISIPLAYVTIVMIKRYAHKEEQLLLLESN